MKTHVLFLCLAAVIGLTLIGCGDDRGREKGYRDLEVAELQNQVADLRSRLAAANAEIERLRTSAPATSGNSTDGLAGDLAGSGAKVGTRGNDVVITITNDILFSPGKATLTSKAKTSLGQVSGALRSRYPDAMIRVEGHTDSQPIRKSNWEDNWHLAGARARSVLHYLSKEGGVDVDRLSFAGYADTRPVASNSTSAGQAQNRRVEIVLIGER